MAYVGRPAFGSSVGKTFGSPFSGYRGDHMAYPDEPWKISLRKYPYPIAVSSPVHRSRSASPRRKVANVQAAAKRRVLEEIMAKIDTTQEDLQALARKVAAWSREAASLSEGLKEEALLLDLGRQADRLAASETENRELNNQERVYRLNKENSQLRRELQQLIHVCKMLLDRRTVKDPWVGDSFSPGPPRSSSRSPPPRQAWQEDDVPSSEQQRRSRRRLHIASAEPRSPAAVVAVPAAGAGVVGLDLAYSAKANGAVAPSTPISGGRRRPPPSSASYDTARIAVGLEGLTDENAVHFVAADRAQADADADARGPGAARLRTVGSRGTAAATAAAAVALPSSPAGVPAVAPLGRANASVGGRYADPWPRLEAQRAVYQQEVDRERRQGGTTLVGVDNTLGELTLNIRPRSRSGSGGGDSGGGTTRSTELRSCMPTFGGFRQQQHEAMEEMPALPGTWLRQHQPQQRQQKQQDEEEEDERQKRMERERLEEVKRVEGELAAVERELAEVVAEEAAEAATEAAEAEAKAEAAQAAARAAAQAAAAQAEVAAAAAEAVASASAKEVVNEPVIGNPVGTKLKFAEGSTAAAPPTPVYQGAQYVAASGTGGSTAAAATAGGGSMPSTVRRDVGVRAHSGTDAVSYDRPAGGSDCGGVAEPLDSILLTEVERLKLINKTLASSLKSYNRVADRLSGVVAEGAAVVPPGTGAARALFPSRSSIDATAAGGRGVDLSALSVPPTGVYPQPTVSVAATYGRSSASASSLPRDISYTASYPASIVARAVAAPSTPPPAVRHLRPDEPRMSWTLSTPPHDRPYGGVTGGLGVVGEVRRLDSALDNHLYGIRQQLQALRHEIVADRLATLTASANGGKAASLPSTAAAAAAHRTSTNPLGGGAGGALDDAAAAAAAAAYREAGGIARLKEDVSELRRQVRDNRRWYRHSLESVVLERSAMFRDLQRRIDRLLSPGV